VKYKFVAGEQFDPAILRKEDERIKNGYLYKFKGFYITGDVGNKDKNNYFYILARVDELGCSQANFFHVFLFLASLPLFVDVSLRGKTLYLYQT